MSRRRRAAGRLLPLAAALLGVAPGAAAAQEGRVDQHYVYVAAESDDEVSLVRFDGERAEVVRTTTVGLYPLETDGPHGVAVAPDGGHWFVSLAHGLPFGHLHKYTTGDDRRVGEVELGLFPASMQVARSGLVFVVNFNLHGDPVPSSVSVVEAEAMAELARIPTCAMPHGSRLTADGLRHYSTCMMDDQLVEIDTRALEVRRRLFLLPGRERALDPGVTEALGGTHAAAHGSPGETRCGPTWAHPEPEGAFVYVACNRNREVLEVDAAAWTVRRRFATGAGPYNLDVTPDGRLLVVTYKGAQAVGVWDLESGEELAAIPTLRRLPHGIALTPDSRYAFISVEGVGGEPGTVEVIDLLELRRQAAVEVGKQAGGIAVWKSVPTPAAGRDG